MVTVNVHTLGGNGMTMTDVTSHQFTQYSQQQVHTLDGNRMTMNNERRHQTPVYTVVNNTFIHWMVTVVNNTFIHWMVTE